MGRRRKFRLGNTNETTDEGSAGWALDRRDWGVGISREAQGKIDSLTGQTASVESTGKEDSTSETARCRRKRTVLPKGGLIKESEVVKLRMERVGKGCLPALSTIGSVIYLYSE